MRGRFAPYVLGIGLLGLAIFMVLFDIYAFFIHDDPFGFLEAALLAGACGFGLVKIGKGDANPSHREALASVLSLWLVVPLFATIPYIISGHLSPINALFESMSGFTTTGATVITDFESIPQSLFLWRSLTQWFGGIGIIVLVIAVLPQLAIAGRQLFFSEAPGPSEEKLTPRLRHTATAVLRVYSGLTLACFLLYWLFGMSPYNAANHAFTTLAAGGFSPEGRSFEGFSPALSWISVLFMGFAGANFALLYRAFAGQPKTLFKDVEFRAYLGIATVAALLMAVALMSLYSPLDALRHGFFQSFSILTTAGYASADFAAWPQRAQVFVVILMFIGGSAGSAGGGVKVVRWLIIAQEVRRGLRRTLHPKGVFRLRVGDRLIPDEIIFSVATFMTLYIGLFAVSTTLLVVFGADFVTAFTASIACLGNIGPGLAGVGPMGNFADLPAISKALLTFDMYAGRLEVVTVFVLFDPRWWRVPRRWR